MSTVPDIPRGKLLILFDGDCLLCNASVAFIISRDPRECFLFERLESEVGKCFQAHYDISGIDSVVLLDNERAYIRSDAAVGIAKELSGGWKWFYFLRWVPRRVRDGVYGMIARNRHKVWGDHSECRLGDEAIASRMFDPSAADS